MADTDNPNSRSLAVSPRDPKARSLRPRKTITTCSTRMNQRCFSNFWSIEHFQIQLELHSPADFMLAPKFGDDDYEFVMKLFPNGKDEETAGYLSLFLLINKCPNPRLRFRVSFTVETAEGPRSCHLNKNLVTINRSGIVTASKFFSLEILKSAENIYTPNDVLTIGCELTVYGESHTSPTYLFTPYPRVGYTSPNATHQFVKTEEPEDGMYELLNTGDFADFTIVASCGQEFKAHMCVLSAKSEYFRALLRNKSTSEFTNKRVEFVDISGTTLSLLLRHIYSSNNEQILTDDTVLTAEFITAVDRLMLTSMRDEISNVLAVHITPENVVPRLCWAEQLRLDDVYSLLIEFFSGHQTQCLDTASWDDLRKNNAPLVIKILETCIKNCATFTRTIDRRIVDRILPA